MGYWISELYPISAVVSFLCLAAMTSSMLQILIDELQLIDILFYDQLNQRLLRWKRHYRLIGDLIHKINAFYGAIFIWYMIKQLINVVTYSFWLVLEIRSLRMFSLQCQLVVYLLRIAMYVSLLTMMAHRIKIQVLYYYIVLYKIINFQVIAMR